VRRRGSLVLGITGLWVGILVLGCGLQLARPVPAIGVRLAAPALTALPGAAPAIPWPDTGQGVVNVAGVGRFGGFGEQKATPIGSVAKVMTAYVLLKKYPLAAGEPGPRITITQADVDDFRARIPSGQSLIEVRVSEVLTLRQALEALMLASANNIAQTLARFHSGTAAAFVEHLNATAGELGMVNTRYADAAGFDPGTVSSASDQVILAEKAMAIPSFAEIVAMKSTVLPVVGTVKNYNDLLGVDGVIGIKTGSTDQAGGNLLFAAQYPVGSLTVTIYGAVFNQPGKDTPSQLAVTNAAVRKLLGALRSALQVFTIMAASTDVGVATAVWEESTRVQVARPVEVLGWPGMPVTVSVQTVAIGKKLAAGQLLGVLTVTAGTSRTTADLHAERAISGPTPWWRLTRLV
jgi:serine-type D-Ala-D-Ala carboxypeptidase (penicillin-binding protein 5/6)